MKKPNERLSLFGLLNIHSKGLKHMKESEICPLLRIGPSAESHIKEILDDISDLVRILDLYDLLIH